MKTITLRQTKRGDYVRQVKFSGTTWIRGDYDRESKTYSLGDSMDMNREIFRKGSTLVYIGFTY